MPPLTPPYCQGRDKATAATRHAPHAPLPSSFHSDDALAASGHSSEGVALRPPRPGMRALGAVSQPGLAHNAPLGALHRHSDTGGDSTALQRRLVQQSLSVSGSGSGLLAPPPTSRLQSASESGGRMPGVEAVTGSSRLRVMSMHGAGRSAGDAMQLRGQVRCQVSGVGATVVTKF